MANASFDQILLKSFDLMILFLLNERSDSNDEKSRWKTDSSHKRYIKVHCHGWHLTDVFIFDYYKTTFRTSSSYQTKVKVVVFVTLTGGHSKIGLAWHKGKWIFTITGVFLGSFKFESHFLALLSPLTRKIMKDIRCN